MHPALKWSLRIIAGLAALVVVLALATALTLYLRPGLAKPALEGVAAAAGVDLKIEQMEIRLSPFAVEMKGIDLQTEGGLEKARLDDLLLVPYVRWPSQNQPLFKKVVVNGLKIQAKSGGGPGSAAPDPAPLAWIFAVDDLLVSGWQLAWQQSDMRLDVKGSEIALSSPGGPERRLTAQVFMDLAMPKDSVNMSGRLDLAAQMRPGPVLDGTLHLDSSDVEVPGVSGPLGLMVKFQLNPELLRLSEVKAELPKIVLKTPGGGPAVQTALHLEASAQGDLRGEEFRIKVASLEAPGIFVMNGEMGYTPQAAWVGGLQGRVHDLAKVQQRLQGFVPQAVQGMRLSGSLPFSLNVVGGGRNSRITAELTTDQMRISWPQYQLQTGFKGSLSSVIATSGIPALKGDITLDGQVRLGMVQMSKFSLRLPLDLDLGKPWQQNFQLSLPPGALQVGGKTLAFNRIDLDARAAMAGPATFALEAKKLTAQGLGEFSGAWEFEDNRLDGWFKGKQMPAGQVVALAEPWLGAKIADWNPAGSLELKFKFYDLLQNPRMRLRVISQGLGCASPDGSILAQNLGPTLDVYFGLGKKPRIKATLAIKGGEALFDRVFMSFEKNPFDLLLRGTMTGPGKYQNVSLGAKAGGMGEIEYKGQLGENKGQWSAQGRLSFSSQDVSTLFKTLVRDTLSANNPALAGLDAKGSVDLGINVKGPLAAAELLGRLKLKDLSLGAQEGASTFKGLNLDLPLAYHFGSKQAAPARSQVKDWGSFEIAELNAGGLKLGPIKNPVALASNKLYLGNSICLPLMGGEVVLQDIEVDQPLSAVYQGKLSAQVNGLDLASVAPEGMAIKGKMAGSLNNIELNRLGVRSEGIIKGDFWGGALIIRDPLMLQPFGRDRTMGASIRFERMDLEELSAALDIGRVTGRISGMIKDLRIAFGQPQSFDLALRSVDEENSSQSVSLKAVNTISVLGTGSGLTGFSVGLFASIFREFPYDKIGIACTLKNDVFQVNGLIKDGDEEYLVKRPFWGGINVINRNQQNRITFSDMMERLKRIGESDKAKEES